MFCKNIFIDAKYTIFIQSLPISQQLWKGNNTNPLQINLFGPRIGLTQLQGKRHDV